MATASGLEVEGEGNKLLPREYMAMSRGTFGVIGWGDDLGFVTRSQQCYQITHNMSWTHPAQNANMSI